MSAAVLDAICTEPAGYVRAIRGGCALCDTRQKRAKSKAHATACAFCVYRIASDNTCRRVL